MALSAVCGLCSVGDYRYIDYKAVQHRTRCLAVCMRRQLVGDNPVVMRREWGDLDEERRTELIQCASFGLR